MALTPCKCNRKLAAHCSPSPAAGLLILLAAASIASLALMPLPAAADDVEDFIDYVQEKCADDPIPEAASCATKFAEVAESLRG